MCLVNNAQSPSQSLPKKTLPELIKTYREVNNLSQTAFGQLFEPTVSQSSVGRWEKGEQEPDKKYLRKIASLLNISLENLLQLFEDSPVQTGSSSMDIKGHTPNKRHLTIFNRGSSDWNRWREKNPDVLPELAGIEPVRKVLTRVDLREADLRGANLSGIALGGAQFLGADLRGVNLSRAFLDSANLRKADLRGAYLVGTDFRDANLAEANLSEATIHGSSFSNAKMGGANLSGAVIKQTSFFMTNLQEANLSNAALDVVDLREAILNRANFSKAYLQNCFIYGISAWDVQLEGATQEELYLSPLASTEENIIDDLQYAFIKTYFKKYQLRIAGEFEKSDNETNSEYCSSTSRSSCLFKQSS